MDKLLFLSVAFMAILILLKS